jgi:hypothetical protein
MIFSVRYSNNSKAKDEAQEVIIKYAHKKEDLINYLETHQNQHTVIHIEDLEHFISEGCNIINDIVVSHPDFNFSVCLGKAQIVAYYPLEVIECAQLLLAPYFFIKYATTFEELQYLLSLGVSEVYIAEALGFELDKVAQICHSRNVKIRAYPNVAQAKAFIENDIKRFFIRPNDVKIYEPYIDVLEFWGPIEKQDVLYHIYTKGEWMTDLRPIIYSLNTPLDNKTILPIWGPTRVACGQKCLKGGKCKICDTLINIGEKLANTVLYDLTGNRTEKIYIDNEGSGIFYCNSGSVSVWIKEKKG